MFNYGLKLWSTNDNYVEEAIKLYDEQVYQYIELYTVPGSFKDTILMWEHLEVPFVIHAAHFRGGMNLAKNENEIRNMILINEAQRFADRLKADKLIVHPGVAGDISETARQLRLVNDERMLVENKPYHALDNGLICNGTTPEEIKYIMETTGLGFCLDVGHAICAANAQHIDPLQQLKVFIKLAPKIFHLTDGDKYGSYDSHLHLGKGNYELQSIIKELPEGCMLTVETEKNNEKDLTDYINDLAIIRQIKASYAKN